MGPVQGVGCINELIGRLTNSPVHDRLQTKKTLLSSPKTFPVDRAMYVDFSHNNVMVSVFATMTLFNQSNEPLNPTEPTKHGTWVISKIVPFSGHMTVERLSCSAHRHSCCFKISTHDVLELDDDRSRGRLGRETRVEEDVRISVDDVSQPLEICSAGQDCMYILDDFVGSQECARNDGLGRFERCGYTGT